MQFGKNMYKIKTRDREFELDNTKGLLILDKWTLFKNKEIQNSIVDTVDITNIIKPVYNFKSNG